MTEVAKIAVLEQRSNQHDKQFERVDATLEKLTEVSISLKEIVRNHEDKHAAQVIENKELKDKLEERRRFSETEREKIYTHISEKFSLFETKIQQLVEDFETATDEIKAKIGNNSAFLDKWKWIIIGGGGVIFLLIDKLPIVENLAKLFVK